MEDFYLYVTPRDSKKIFTANSGGEFMVELPESLKLGTGWKCALKEIKLEGHKDKNSFDIIASFCQESINKGLQILRRVYLKSAGLQKIYKEGYYIRLNTCDLHLFKIRLVDIHTREVTDTRNVELTLHFKHG